MTHCKAAAILETMWGTPGKAPGWFRINPQNHTGRRLYWLLGHKDLWCTNVCQQQVANAQQHGKPDPSWLERNLKRLDMELLLVCGRIAQQTFAVCRYRPQCRIVEIPHPAARTWTKQSLLEYQRIIQGLNQP